MLLHQALQQATQQLAQQGIPSPANDAKRLLLWCMEIDSMEYTQLSKSCSLNKKTLLKFGSVIEQRLLRRPVSQIVGSRAFYGRDFFVNTDVLDPRSDSEVIVDEVLLRLKKSGVERPKILDLGTGSGAILLTLLGECVDASGLGVDISVKALRVAQENAKRLSLEHRTTLKQGDWLHGVEGLFDVIVCNPPYVSEDQWFDLEEDIRLWEPRCALTCDGCDGYSAYEKIIPNVASFLKPSGFCAFEIGFGQSMRVATMLECSGFLTEITADMEGIKRCVTGDLIDY